MRGGHKRSKKYYDSSNRRGGASSGRGGKKKYSRYDNRDYEYQYVQKDRKRYTKKEMLDLQEGLSIGDDYLDELVSKYDYLFLKELQEPIGEGEVDPDAYQETFIHNNDRDKRKRYQERQDNRYNEKSDRFSKKNFEKFDFEEKELTTEDLENADKLLEKKYNESKFEANSDLPSWANEDYDDDIPLWGDADINEVKKETEDAEGWTNKFIKKLNKDDVEDENSESSESYEDDSDDEPQQKFTAEDINNLPNILQMMKQAGPAPPKQAQTNIHDLQSQLSNFVSDSQAARRPQQPPQQ